MNRTTFSVFLVFSLTGLLISWCSSSQRLLAGETPVHDDAEVSRVAAFIDACIEEQLEKAKVTPAAIADDAEFLRRVYLDVAGKVPPVADVRAFLDDTSPDKRRALVNRLLDGPRYPMHFARRWRSVWIPANNSNPMVTFQQVGFEHWLRMQLAEDVSYSQLVAKILVLPSGQRLVRVNDVVYSNDGSTSPAAFFGSRQLNRDDIAAAVARTMLGVRIECAQCHDHPFDSWRQDQFHSFAALFDGVAAVARSARGRGQPPPPPSRAKPVFLDGTVPKSTNSQEHLGEVASWMIAPENQYFARAAVNRFWQDFFGVGIVDPVDDFSDHNPPSHPRLLDGLAREFIAHEFDVKFMIRTITATRAYQRTSHQEGSLADPRLFASSKVRALTADQLWDSLEQLTGISAPLQARETLIFNPVSARAEFNRLFDGGMTSSGEPSTTILQALTLMNGRMATEATTLTRGATLSAIVEYPGLSTTEKIETLYLSTLSRRPQPQELSRAITYVTEGSNAALLSDILWVLLNSSEYVTNH